jgi:proteasome accessory factor C
VPGTDPAGPLARALGKLDSVLGTRGSVVVDVGGTDHLDALQRATAAGEQVELDYYSFARDEMTQRVVDPWRVFHAFGVWYLLGYCHRADAERMFRIDRVRALRPTGAPIERRPTRDDADLADLVYQPADDDLRVRLLLEASATWVVEDSRPELVVERPDGRVEVVLPVSAPAFLERLVLGLGPAVTVLDPPEARRWIADAAARILSRYGVSA